jgi:hypothetical protein
MKREPSREGLPRISFSRKARYAQSKWDFGFIRGYLTDRQISRYLRAGKYRRNQIHHPAGVVMAI